MSYHYLSDNLFQDLCNFSTRKSEFSSPFKANSFKSSPWILVRETNFFCFNYSFFQKLHYRTVSSIGRCRSTQKICFIRFTDNFLVMLKVNVTCIEFFLITFMKMCLCCRKIYIIHFPPHQTISNVLNVFSHCTYVLPTWAFVYPWNKVFIWQLFLCCSTFLDFNLIPNAKKALVFWGIRMLKELTSMEIIFEVLIYDNLFRISNDQDFLWTIVNTYNAILLILSQVHWLNQGSGHKPLSFNKLDLYLLWVSFLWHSKGFPKL